MDSPVVSLGEVKLRGISAAVDRNTVPCLNWHDRGSEMKTSRRSVSSDLEWVTSDFRHIMFI